MQRRGGMLKALASVLVFVFCVINSHGLVSGQDDFDDYVEFQVDSDSGDSVLVGKNAAEEKKALIAIYLSTSGDTWSNSFGWGADSDESHCSWYGIQCNENGYVTEIHLAANKLNGTMDDVLGHLPYLELVDISLNYLREGLPPSLKGLKRVQRFDAGYNYLNVNLDMFDGWANLESLCLRWNTLITGTLKSLANVKKLESLDLRDNEMSSLTLDGLENFPALHVLELGKTGLKGKIPDAFSNLKSLERFVAHKNRLEGELPKSLLALPNLEVLDLGDNMLYGNIGQLGSPLLVELHLGNNNFTSSSVSFSALEKIEKIDFSGNDLGGEIPLNFYKLDSLVSFRCQNCNLEGFLPLPANSLPNLEELILYNNKLTGALPSLAISTMHRLRTLELDGNRFYGSLPAELPQRIEKINLARNSLSGPIPESYRSLSSLEIARFEQNKLTGKVPSIFEEMDSLKLFSLHDNKLTGFDAGFAGGKRTWPLGLDGRQERGVEGTIVLYHNDFPAELLEGLTDGDHRVYKTCGTMNDFFIAVLRNAGWMSTTDSLYHAAYGDCYPRGNARDLLPIQRTSRFPDVDQLSDKGLLTQNIAYMRRSFPEEYSFYPQSFNVPHQMEEFQEAFDKSENKMWLVKPRARCCGDGIRLINSTDVVTSLIDPEIGEWYVQQFVSPPAFIRAPNASEYKFVFRLFALVTSFDPLKVYLHREGLIFYTHTPYSVDDQTAKRSYISDYFFTDAQTTMFEFVQQYFDHLRETKEFDPDVIWERIKSVVVKSLFSANKRTSTMERQTTTPNTAYEIYGYDIVLDHNFMPFLCEINETPNMGLEVNYHPDYHGLGQAMENEDAKYKLKLMEDTLSISDVEPRYTVDERVSMEGYVTKLVQDSLCQGDQFEMTDIEAEHPCITRNDVTILARLEGELRRRETMTDMDMVYPCVTCSEYFPIVKFQVESRANYLVVWWSRSRPGGSSAEKIYDGELWTKFLNEHVKSV